MIRRAAATLALLATTAVAASAWMPPSPVANLLYRAADPADLRAQLAAHRDSVAASDSLDAAESWYWLGVSYDRSGVRDSAIAALRRSLVTRKGADDAVALADALLRSGAREAVAEAARLLAPVRDQFAFDRSPQGALVRLRAAWAEALAGDPDAARRVVTGRTADLSPTRQPPPQGGVWAARFAPLLLERGTDEAGLVLLERAIAATRGRDSALVALALRSAPGLDVAAVVRRADSTLARSAAGAPLARLAVKADDGARLTAWALRARPRGPLAVLLPAADAETFSGADSLLAQLHRAGVAVAILDTRGSRASASAAAPLPTVWAGREDAFARRTARDLGAVIAAALAATGADPTRVCVVAEGAMAMPAALAAKTDPRVRAVVLAGAAPSGAERGWLAATLTAARVPTFFQQGPEDVYGNEVVDRIAMLLRPRDARVADSQGAGRGFELFRAGPAVGRRLTDWLAAEWKSRPSTPRAPRR